MTLKKNEVIEYKLTETNLITGYQLWNKKKRPDLIDNPDPPDEMIEEGLFDKYDRPYWQLSDDIITKQALPPPSQLQVAKDYIDNLSRYEMLKLICKGIQNKNDNDYEYFEGMVNQL
jgi:hypothetical protein